jgi:S-adenosylmethionine:tRNA-ribosyltransferase-isomerase (queuine synthetase)
MRGHLRSKGHLLTPAVKEIRRTRAKRLLHWHAENGHENILFKDEKSFTVEEKHNNQYNTIYAQKSLEVRSEGAGGHHTPYVMVW